MARLNISGRWPSGRAPHSNDVGFDERRLIYLADRNVGFEITEPRR
jgi:hypothetical protein